MRSFTGNIPPLKRTIIYSNQNCIYYLIEVFREKCTGQNEWVICREFDRHIKLVSGMVSGGTHACLGYQHNLGLLDYF